MREEIVSFWNSKNVFIQTFDRRMHFKLTDTMFLKIRIILTKELRPP